MPLLVTADKDVCLQWVIQILTVTACYKPSPTCRQKICFGRWCTTLSLLFIKHQTNQYLETFFLKLLSTVLTDLFCYSTLSILKVHPRSHPDLQVRSIEWFHHFIANFEMSFYALGTTFYTKARCVFLIWTIDSSPIDEMQTDLFLSFLRFSNLWGKKYYITGKNLSCTQKITFYKGFYELTHICSKRLSFSANTSCYFIIWRSNTYQ